MRIADIASAPVYITHPGQPLAVAAQEMRARGVGALVVVEPRAPRPRPIGILTDRDILCGQLTQCADLHCLAVKDVMTRDPLTISPSAGLAETIGKMSARGVRRAPVVDETGALVGILTLDDVLPVIAQELNDLTGITQVQGLSGHDQAQRDPP